MKVSKKKIVLSVLKRLILFKQPIRIVQFGWTVSTAYGAGSKIATLSPSNAGSGSAPSGYTFVCWLEFATAGWVGAIYPESLTASSTNIWTATAKAATSGMSVYGSALYIRNELL